MQRAESDALLHRLFSRHFNDAISAALRLERHLEGVDLPFDFRAQLRELEYPPQPKLPRGLESFIYYFVPHSGWGSHNPFPEDPLDPNFVYCCDGMGLNLGCPVRLLRALDALARLAPTCQREVREGLANPTKHLATVEELLWLDAWKSPSEMRRGGPIPGARGDVDWALTAGSFPIYLEAKFRPSDWPRNTDQGTFVPIQGSFLGKASHKFPDPPSEAALHLVAITVFENITLDIIHLIGKELEANPQVHGVVFKTLGQMTHLLSVERIVWTRVAGLLARPATKDFPTNYVVPFHISQREARIAGRAQTKSPGSESSTSRVLCDGLQPRLDSPLLIPEDGAYRMNITSRGRDGEPRYVAIPKEIWLSDENPGPPLAPSPTV